MREWVRGLGGRSRAGSSDPADERLDQLERLARMRDDGVLDASEYTTEKARILSDQPRAGLMCRWNAYVGEPLPHG